MFCFIFSKYSRTLIPCNTTGARTTTSKCVFVLWGGWSPPDWGGWAGSGPGAPRAISPDPRTVPERFTARLVPPGVPHGVWGGGGPAALHGVWRRTALASPGSHQKPCAGHPPKLPSVQFRGEALHSAGLGSDSWWEYSSVHSLTNIPNGNLANQMDHFLNPLDLLCVSIW